MCFILFWVGRGDSVLLWYRLYGKMYLFQELDGWSERLFNVESSVCVGWCSYVKLLCCCWLFLYCSSCDYLVLCLDIVCLFAMCCCDVFCLCVSWLLFRCSFVVC